MSSAPSEDTGGSTAGVGMRVGLAKKGAYFSLSGAISSLALMTLPSDRTALSRSI